MQTLLLDTASWDLTLDASGNVAVASEPYSLAQDAASALRTYLGEVFYNTTLGVPYLQQIFGKTPSLPLLREELVAVAETVPDVASAEVFFTQVTDRIVSGQVQVTPASGLPTSVATFTAVNPQVA